MRCSEDHTMKTVKVERGCDAEAGLAAGGALRFERGAGAMTGDATLSVKDGGLALHYADGSSVLIKD